MSKRTMATLGYWLFALCLALSAPEVAAAEQDTHRTIFKRGILPYMVEYLNEPSRTQMREWVAAHFDFSVQGENTVAYNPNILSASYQKILGCYSNELPKMKALAEGNGWKFEDMLVHMKTNFTAKNPWKDIKKFGYFEGKNGVLADSGGAISDVTDTAYTGSARILTGASSGTSAYVYFGFEEPFDEVNLVLATPGQAVQMTWQYWAGQSWNNMSVGDATNSLQASGRVRFSPPADWARNSLNGSMQKWWIRLSVQKASTYPVISQAYGDDWLVTGQSNQCRGWDQTASTILNRGTPVEYNPDPPAGASARFRHQARATGYWAPNYVYLNPANVQNGVRTAAKYAAGETLSTLQASSFYNAVMFDSASGDLTSGIASPSAPELSSDVGEPWVQASTARYAETCRLIKLEMPSLLLGANAYPYMMDFVSAGDWALYEYHSYSRQSSSPRSITMQDAGSGKIESYDQYIDSNNQKHLKGFFIYNDVVGYDDKRDFYWDRANRGPMACLTKHYIAMNSNVFFSYYTEGGFRYDFIDEVFVYKSSTSLTSSVSPDTSAVTKTIKGKDFSSLVSYPYYGMKIVIGEDVLTVKKVDNQTLTTTDPIRFSHNLDETVKIIGVLHQATEALPPLASIHTWNYYFPAMDVDIGLPDTSGYNGGERNLNWKAGADIGGGPEIWRRDFTKAIVLHRTAFYDTPKAQYTTYCQEIPLDAVYYPLYTDGKTGAGVKSISLRAGEGVILLKSPIGGSDGATTPLAPPTNLRLN